MFDRIQQQIKQQHNANQDIFLYKPLIKGTPRDRTGHGCYTEFMTESEFYLLCFFASITSLTFCASSYTENGF